MLKPSQDASRDDPTLADKEAILASLNIKAMTFNGKVISNGKELEKNNFELVASRIKQRTFYTTGLSHSAPEKKL